MQKKVIPIVYASDENFLRQTYLSIYSVLACRKSDYILKFYILMPEKCEKGQYNEKWTFINYSIDYRFISSEYFQNVKMVLQNISKPTYYRLLIPVILPEYDKCLYLDGDTICCSDIKELFEIELEDSLLAASMGAMLSFNASYWEKALSLPCAKYYINAGVLIMNLQQMRLEEKTEEFLKCSEKELPCQDQDVLNICCYNRIKILPLKFNVYSTAFNMPEKNLLKRFNKLEIQNAISNPVIIHYPGEYSKPWNNIHCVKSHEWWNYAIQAFDKTLILELRCKAINRMKRYNYNILFEKIRECSQLVIFGFSEVGKRFCDEVDKKYSNKVVCFCDNAKEKWGNNYKNYKVKNLTAIKKEHPDALIVVTSQNYSDEIQRQLIQEKFDLTQVIIYRKKTLNYIYSMDKKYWEEIKKEICLDKISWQECLASDCKIF